MIRVKARYIVIRLRHEGDQSRALGEMLGSIVKSKVGIDYGSYGASMVGNLVVVEYLPHSQIAVIRCDAPACKYVLFTIATIGEISGLKCSMSILWISGILKRAMRRILKYIKMEKELERR
ncbi:RNAse P component 2 [Encephalitozoon intestinalis]